MKIYRIVPKVVWDEVVDEIPMAPIDEKDGYIHLSPHDQVLNTANLYFPPDTKPVVLCFEDVVFGENLKWEGVESRGDVLFPHLYGKMLQRKDVCAVIALQHNGKEYVGFEG